MAESGFALLKALALGTIFYSLAGENVKKVHKMEISIRFCHMLRKIYGF